MKQSSLSITRLIIILTLATAAVISAKGDPLDNWTPANLDPTIVFGGGQGSLLRSVTYGHGRWVAVGQNASDDNAAIQTSEDGLNWTLRTTGDYSILDLYDVTYGNGMFVAVGWDSFGGKNIYSSTNGINWVPHVTALSTISSVAFGNNLFVAVGGATTWQSGTQTNKNIYASSDGVTWEAINSGAEANLSDVAFGDGLFVAVNGSGYVYFSNDGHFWNITLITGLGGEVSFGNGLFIASGRVGTNFISTDGLNWSAVTNSIQSTFGHVIYADGMFVAQTSSNVFSSVDGTNWIRRGLQLPSNVTLTDISTGNQKIAVTGYAFPSSPSIKPVAYLSDPLIDVGIHSGFPPQLTLSGLTGRNYRVEFVVDFSSTNWQSLTNFTLTNSPVPWSDNQATNTSRFYRTRTFAVRVGSGQVKNGLCAFSSATVVRGP